ncbi:Alpha-1,3-mannosyltransferase-like protein [Agyrium rufum]|nr:Alpha-1,3-mannosyltransferase-like protein [Agyrium rufum]
MEQEKQSIGFFHPDLGIGGAERLVIDAAVGLQDLGYKVTIFTSHCDPMHCFDEARDGTLDVRVRGHTIFPDTLFGRFKILFSILRQLHLLITISLSGELKRLRPTAFFIDQLSAGIPLLRYLQPHTHILFYCHFPDLLLVQQRKTLLKRIWRIGFDRLEGWSMSGADRVVVNSKFTKGIVAGVWPQLGRDREIGVVYPCVNTKAAGGSEKEQTKGGMGEGLWKGKKVILSINRFERKKDVGLAIRAYAALDQTIRRKARLVIAGGYDNRVQENVSYHEELVSLAQGLSLETATAKNVVTALNMPDEIEVLFLLSVPAQLKDMLLQHASLLVYTPSNEHFGIVPLEAMLVSVPVLAANSGGPLETVVDGQTGWLRSVDENKAWTAVMKRVLQDLSQQNLEKIGRAGRDRIIAEFSESTMARKLDEELQAMIAGPRSRTWELQDLLLALGLLGMGVVAVVSIAITQLDRWYISSK